MRCVLVNGAHLKADATCALCGQKIGENYVREIGSRLVYCDFRCYGVAVETALTALSFRAPALSGWTRRS